MATIRETILEYPSIEDMEGFLKKVVFVKRGINPEAECTAENMKQVGLCVADTYAMMVNSQDFSENKLSVTHPRSFYIQKLFANTVRIIPQTDNFCKIMFGIFANHS